MDKSTLANILKPILGILSLCFWFGSSFLWQYFDAHMPTTAQPESGRIIPLTNHGWIVYLTSGEHDFLYSLMALGMLFFFATAAVHYFWIYRRNRIRK